jgi:hypothetical protein
VKSSLLACGVVSLAMFGLWYSGGGPSAPAPSPATAAPAISAAVSHGNLSVHFIHGPDSVTATKVATLQEGLEAGWAVVNETGNVNMLIVENHSPDYELFIQEGDLIRGGRQDRLIASDMLLPPNSTNVSLPVHCVEQGRWTNRGNESATRFNKCDQFVATNAIRYANATGQQGEVWNNVKEQQSKLTARVGVKVTAAESETSLQLALENTALQTRVAQFVEALQPAGENRSDIVGVVFLVNGRVRTVEEYGSNALFRKAWPKLLRSVATDAVAEKTDKPLPPPATSREIERCVAEARNPTASPNVAVAQNDPQPTLSGRSGETRILEARYANPVCRVPVLAGRSGGTRSGLLNEGGGNRRPTPQAAQPGLNPARPAADNVIMGGSVAGNVNSGQLRQLAEQWGSMPAQQRVATLDRLTRDIPTRSRAQIEEYLRTAGTMPQIQAQSHENAPPDHRQLVNFSVGVFEAMENENNASLGVPMQSGTENSGNRLNVNRVDNQTSLVSEARDPARQNAVLHRSYLKK